MKRSNKVKSHQRAFDAQAFLDSAGVSRKIAEFRRRQSIFAQGDPADDVLYIQQGGVKLCVVNGAGREAVVAMLGPGDFFGEGCRRVSTSLRPLVMEFSEHFHLR